MFQNCRPMKIFKYTGAIAASTMGAGFATGQEILQFFTVSGLASMAGVALMIVLVMLIAASITLSAEQHKGQPDYHPYRYFTGEWLGGFFQIFGCVMVVLFVIVCVSGAGATIELCFGIPSWMGCLAISLLVLATYLSGMRRLVDILGLIGPVAVVFIIFVSMLAVEKYYPQLSDVPTILQTATFPSTSDHWWLSMLMYNASNLFFPILLMTEMVQSASRPREVTWGCIFGTATFAVGLGAVNLGMLTVLDQLEGVAVPSVVMARAVAPVFGVIFSVLLIVLVYGSSSAIFFVAAGQISPFLKGNTKLTAVLIWLLSLTSGLIPFATLVNVVYTFMGYFCLLMIGGILWKLPRLVRWAIEQCKCVNPLA